MTQMPAYKKYVETITKEGFFSFFSTCEPEEWFSTKELQMFTFPRNAGSLAGRYLIKRTIYGHLNKQVKMHEIEILNNEFGKPEIFLGSNIRRETEIAGIKKIICSISHSKNYIAGMTIFCF
jgi:phosphopantetheinyl transferase (holo-ACP synthase)